MSAVHPIRIELRQFKNRRRTMKVYKCIEFAKEVVYRLSVKPKTSKCKSCFAQGRKEDYFWLYTGLMAQRRNYEVELSFKEFVSFTKIDTCYYCGDKVRWYPHKTEEATGAYNLDRKKNNLGYTLGNCVVCCGICNRMKMNMDEITFLERINKIDKQGPRFCPIEV